MTSDWFSLMSDIIDQCWEWFTYLWGAGNLAILFALIVIGIVIDRLINPLVGHAISAAISGGRSLPSDRTREQKRNARAVRKRVRHLERSSKVKGSAYKD